MNNSIMIIAVLMIFFCTVMLNKLFFKEILRINVVFNFIWISTIMLYLLNNAGWYSVSEQVNSYAIYTLLTYNIVYYIFSPKRDGQTVTLSQDEKTILLNDYDAVVRSSLIYTVNVILWIYHLPYFIKAIRILTSEGFSRLRYYAYDSASGFASTFNLIILQNINYMFYMVVLLLWIIGFVNRHNSRKLMVFALIDLISYVLTFGGRGPVFIAIIFFAASILVFHKGRLIFWIVKNKKILITISITVIVGLYLVSLRSFGNSVISTLFAYFSAPFIFLSEAIKHGVIIYNSTHGAGMFEAAVFPTEIILNIFGLKSGYSSNVITAALDNQLVISSLGYRYNALGTMMAVFLFDFGVAGIFIGSALFSLLGLCIEHHYIKTRNMSGLLIYLFMIYYTVISVQSFYVRMAALFAFAFISIFTSKKRIVKFVFRKM